jgi:hypothetical protein
MPCAGARRRCCELEFRIARRRAELRNRSTDLPERALHTAFTTARSPLATSRQPDQPDLTFPAWLSSPLSPNPN